MKGTKDLKTNKGITLIALVITIIVMLILVAVTITMAVNGGLFEYASNAGTKTNAARDAEQEFANLDADMTVDQLIEKYTTIIDEDVQSGLENDNGGGGMPTVRDCEGCENGIIVGYKCGQSDCNVISSSYADESYYYGKCPRCGLEYKGDYPGSSYIECFFAGGQCTGDNVGIIDLEYVEGFKLDGCDHQPDGKPLKNGYACPNCIESVSDCQKCTNGIIYGYKCQAVGCGRISCNLSEEGSDVIYEECDHREPFSMQVRNYYLCPDCTV